MQPFHFKTAVYCCAIIGVFSLLPAKAQNKLDLNGEYIILSGGPALRAWEELRRDEHRHDRWWGNFIRSARLRMEELQKKYDNQVQITWLVYKQGYEARQHEDGKPLISNILSVREKFIDQFAINLLWIDSGQEVINYINHGRDRNTIKVSGFEFFGHSNLKCMMLDYGNSNLGASRAYLHENQLGLLNRSAFSRKAYSRSWGCHSGESFCQKFRKATGVRMVGAVGKTDYSVLSSMQLPVVSQGGRWVTR